MFNVYLNVFSHFSFNSLDIVLKQTIAFRNLGNNQYGRNLNNDTWVNLSISVFFGNSTEIT